MNIGVGRTPRNSISRCLLSQKWRHRKGSENRSPLRNHALGRSHRGLRMRCARQHWAFEPTIVLHEKRSRQGGRKRSQESGALANSSCEDHFNLSPQIYSCFTFQPPVPIESTGVQPGALQTRALCARHSLLVLISCRVAETPLGKRSVRATCAGHVSGRLQPMRGTVPREYARTQHKQAFLTSDKHR